LNISRKNPQRKAGQVYAPLYSAVKKYLREERIPLHVPLHGRGPGAPDLFRKGFHSLMRLDLTELGPLDDLHLPRGALKKAQKLAAQLFNAEETFFLVNGVTGGLLALILSFCRPGDKVLLSRLAHKAVLHGIALSGALPIYLPVEMDKPTGFPLNVSLDSVRKALAQHPDARLLLLTSPSYWGVTADLKSIKKAAADYGVIFAVDEAHGGHLPFYREKLSHSAAAEVDIWLHSAHKSLGALTPGALLHLGRNINSSKIRFWLGALQTSSPPYPVMISLDLIRRQMAIKGEKLFNAAWKWARYLRCDLVKNGFLILSSRMTGKYGLGLDPCRITLLLPGGGGSLLAERLAQKYGIQVEIHADGYLLAIAGPSQIGLSPDAVSKRFTMARDDLSLNTAFRGKICSFSPSLFRGSGKGSSARGGVICSEFSPFSLTPREALAAPSSNISLEDSAGRISAEMVVLSPPGIPLLAPGERIEEDTLSYLLKVRDGKAIFQGAADPTLKTVKVVSGTDNMIK
jgi:arginine decarboxylase